MLTNHLKSCFYVGAKVMSLESKKIIILGVDCLDYNLIRKWRLDHYMLGSFGYHFVGLDLYTPVIWAKFLTGIDVTKHGFTSKRLSLIKRIKTLYYMRYLLYFFKGVINNLHHYGDKCISKVNGISLFDVKNIVSKFIKLDNYNRLSLHERMTLKLLIKAAYSERLPRKFMNRTFVYEAINRGLRTLLIEFPPINDNIYSIVRNALYFYIGTSPNERQVFLDYVWKITDTTLDILLKNFDNYDVIMWYTPVIDIASHMFYRPKNLAYMIRLYTVYKRLGKKIEKIVSEINDDAIILIASDHGYNPVRQDHSHFGYWSINAKIMRKLRTVLDFSPLIKHYISIIHR